MKTDDKDRLRVPIKQRLSSFSDELKYKLVKEEQINLTKTRAFEFLELKEFDGERAVRQGHVQYLYDELIAHRFLWHLVHLAKARVGDSPDEFRINGQHTCWMRGSVPESLEPLVAECTLETYVVPDMRQLRNLYACFDRGAPRSLGHIGKVLLMGSAASDGIHQWLLNKLVAGFRVYFCDDWNHANANPNDLTGLIDKSYSTLFNTVGRFLTIHGQDFPREGKRAGVIAALFATFEKAVGDSDAFWTPVYNGLGLEDKKDARYKLRLFLQSHGHTHNPSTTLISTEDLYRVCIAAWNRWRAKEEVEMLKPTEKRVKAK